MSAAIEFDNLTLGYDHHPAVHHLNGVVESGALLAVAGPNGAGKSTLLKGIAGLLKPLDGRVALAPGLRRRIGYLPQSSTVDTSFPISLTEFVSLGLWLEVGLIGRIAGARARRVRDAIEQLGLSGYERRGLDTLSGGQLQRALFARLIVQDAKVLLLDEPFAGIDGQTIDELCGLLERWHQEGRTVLAVLHDLEQVHARFPETLLLAREVVAWGPTSEALAPARLAEARQRLGAFDEHAEWCEGPTARSPAA